MDKKLLFILVLVLALVSTSESRGSRRRSRSSGRSRYRSRRSSSRRSTYGSRRGSSGGSSYGSRRGGFFGRVWNRVQPYINTAGSEPQSYGGHVGGYGGSEYGPMGGHVGRLAECGTRTFPYVHGIRSAAGGWHHGDEKTQIMKELKDLREKDFDTYHASMLIAADELSKYMDEEEVKQKLQYIDDMLSGGADNKELFKLLEEAEIEEATQEDEDEQRSNQ